MENSKKCVFLHLHDFLSGNEILCPPNWAIIIEVQFVPRNKAFIVQVYWDCILLSLLPLYVNEYLLYSPEVVLQNMNRMPNFVQ
jgi:hypothetical protein